MDEKITFFFGENWKAFLKTISPESVASAKKDIVDWLGEDAVSGKSVLDIGCGSGIHSLVFHSLKPDNLVSFDADRQSVEATRSLWEKSGKPSSWRVEQGSVLDTDYLYRLGGGSYDIVYSWGVLHHTGEMWKAVENAASMVRKSGLFWIALYGKGPYYEHDLQQKRAYNAAGYLGKKVMVAKAIYKKMRERAQTGKNPFTWNFKKERGMDVYHDIIDWLGGLPYEVATEEEITDFLAPRGFVKKKVLLYPERHCNIYLFSLQ